MHSTPNHLMYQFSIALMFENCVKYGPLNRYKMMPPCPLTISTMGNGISILKTFIPQTASLKGFWRLLLVPRIYQSWQRWPTAELPAGVAPQLPSQPSPTRPLTWPGPQHGLAQGWLRLKWAKGRFWLKKLTKITVLRIEFSVVDNLSGPQESIFSLFRRPQLNSRNQ